MTDRSYFEILLITNEDCHIWCSKAALTSQPVDVCVSVINVCNKIQINLIKCPAEPRDCL